MVKQSRAVVAAFALAAVLASLLTGTPVQATAAPAAPAAPQLAALSGSSFDPGNIISDATFYNSNSMTEGQIQQFLEGQVGSCASGYSCLKSYSQDTASRPAGRCTPYVGAANEPASRIIYKVAQACGINPQVLLVTLQKENSLVTNRAPSADSYQTAMGFACPDTAACDSQYFGFFNQVYSAARQFLIYAGNPGLFNFDVGLRSIQFSTKSYCGASTVNIQNQATANLYNYTPYQPDAAALANLNGIGGDCSSYGNRNFWVFFNNWFGSPTAGGAQVMAELYQQQGGAGGWLGSATSSFDTVTANGGGYRQSFSGGTIFWSPGAGARIVSGAILDTYRAWGGESGSLGWPTAPVAQLTASGITGQVQTFQNGTVHWTPSAGGMITVGDIAALYGSLQREAGFLGWPTSGPTSVASGLAQTFQNGAIYWTAGTGARLVTGAILAAYTSSAGPTGPIGWPNGAVREITTNGITGQLQTFQTGAIYWTAAGGARLVTGQISALYQLVGGVTGFMGWPTGAVSAVGAGLYQAFQNGSIYWTAESGARLVTGAVLSAYLGAGGPAGVAGWPTGNVSEVSGNGVTGQSQSFQNATILWAAQAGGHVVADPMAGLYGQVGGYSGFMGWPTGDLSASAGGSKQTFQNGSIYWTAAAGPRLVTGAILGAYVANGGSSGAAGWPTGNVGQDSGNGSAGQVQKFQNGAIYWTSAGGSHLVTGGLYAFYLTQNEYRGAVGWPIGEALCGPDGACTQEFQSGTIVWSAAGGGHLASSPDIEAVHARMGGASGVLGRALAATVAIAGGKKQSYQGGTIYWSAATGGFAVVGSSDSLYSQVGGPAGFMGWPSSDPLVGGGGTSQTFQNGAIYATTSAGARLVTGALLTSYVAAGGPVGAAGWPTGNVTQISGNGAVGQIQSFQNGSIYWTAASGGHLLTDSVGALYTAVGGATGFMGWPIADSVASDGGSSQAFMNGAIYWTSTNGARLVTGAVLTAYQLGSGPAGNAGWPIGNVTQLNGGGVAGVVQSFQNGAIYWTAVGGGHQVTGGIFSFYATQRAQGGSLGWPTGDAVCAQDGSCSQEFQGGTVLWSAAGGARIGTVPEIDAVYASAGGASGVLGAATGGTSAVAGGKKQSYQGGSIYWSATTGGFAVVGAFDTLYSAVGGPGGFMGWPTQPSGDGAGGSSQVFQNGSIYFSADAGARLVTGSILTAYLAGTGPAGAAGWPTGNVGQSSGNSTAGQVQSFQNGAIYWTASGGGHQVTGGIYSYFVAQNEYRGTLGWPTGDAVCGSDSSCTQQFQGGSVIWSPTDGARRG